MKILATQIEKGMIIKFRGLDTISESMAMWYPLSCSKSIATHSIIKSSPEYKVLTASEVISTGTYRTQHKRNVEKHIEITLEGVDGICAISPKKKVVLVQ
mgnify:CR=1 FL=1|tara:strand:+ start:1102 stop:1401 length:300 start_codon:yes stop_codon:yes gene_type:complete